MLNNFREMDFVGQFLSLVLAVIFISGAYFLISYGTSTKVHNGYYLYHSLNSPYSIWINWENAPNEQCFKTYEKDEVIDVLNRLRASRLKD